MAIEPVQQPDFRTGSTEDEKTHSPELKELSSNNQNVDSVDSYGNGSTTETPAGKKKWWHSVKKRGSATQIVIAAILAIAIGLPVALAVENVPDAVRPILGIPGNLWLRALKAIGE